jgi:hypothetical protein
MIDAAHALLHPPSRIVANKVKIVFFPETALAPRCLDLVERLDRLDMWWEAESEHVSAIKAGSTLEFQLDFDFPEVIVRPDLSVVRANYAYESIGSLQDESLANVIMRYSALTPREKRMNGWEHRELAEQVGDPNCTKLYTPYGVWIKWIEKKFAHRAEAEQGCDGGESAIISEDLRPKSESRDSAVSSSE